MLMTQSGWVLLGINCWRNTSVPLHSLDKIQVFLVTNVGAWIFTSGESLTTSRRQKFFASFRLFTTIAATFIFIFESVWRCCLLIILEREFHTISISVFLLFAFVGTRMIVDILIFTGGTAIATAITLFRYLMKRLFCIL